MADRGSNTTALTPNVVFAPVQICRNGKPVAAMRTTFFDAGSVSVVRYSPLAHDVADLASTSKYVGLLRLPPIGCDPLKREKALVCPVGTILE